MNSNGNMNTQLNYAAGIRIGSDSNANIVWNMKGNNNGVDFFTHTWYNDPFAPPAGPADCQLIFRDSLFNTGPLTCETTFLRNAVEIMDNGLGNENGLCESNETCLYTPNIGAYQGHGNLISAGPFTNGVITNVTLMKYEFNGY